MLQLRFAHSKKSSSPNANNARARAPKAPAGGGSGWGMVHDADKEGSESVVRVSKSYDEAQAKALYRLSSPIPVPEWDETAPDLIIGFNEYKFRSRDAYRTAIHQYVRDGQHIATILPQHVHLSIAWHGRLPAQFMQGLQKVAGVTLSQEAQLAEDDRARVVAALIESINAKTALSLLQLGVVKAGPASLVARKTNAGGVDASAKSVVKALTSHRPAVVVCTSDERAWVEANVVMTARRSRVDVEVLCLDDVSSPGHSAAMADGVQAYNEYAAACRAKGLPIRSIDGSVVPTTPTDNVATGLRDLLGATPALCLHGVAIAVGTFGVSKLLRDAARLHAMVYRRDDISLREAKML